MNRMSVESLELLLEKQYQHDFSGRVAEDKEEMLRKYAKFVDIMGIGEVGARWTLQFKQRLCSPCDSFPGHNSVDLQCVAHRFIGKETCKA